MRKLKELLFLKQLKGVGDTTINKKYISGLEEMDGIDGCISLVKKNNPKLTDNDIRNAVEIAEQKYSEYIHNEQISCITIFDDEYPSNLNDLEDKKPIIIYAMGNIDCLGEKSVSVVGTRQPSNWSMRVERKLVERIIEVSNNVIVSGLALGCDKIAHEATLTANGQTIAVLPSGLNNITPASNKKLACDIISKGGCLISAYEPNIKAQKSTYIERDAIIAAISDATIVIECNIKSGTMHTVNDAYRINRELACYFCEDETKGKYGGNNYMADNLNAYKISNLEDLKYFFNVIMSSSQVKRESHRQIGLKDLI